MDNMKMISGYRGRPTVFVNTTPHPLTFRDHDGNTVEVPCDPGCVLNAKAEEVPGDSPEFVVTQFVGTPEGKALLDRIESEAKDRFPGLQVRVIGSMIAVRAYPGRVVGVTPVPGYERMPDGQKLMDAEKLAVADSRKEVSIETPAGRLTAEIKGAYSEYPGIWLLFDDGEEHDYDNLVGMLEYHTSRDIVQNVVYRLGAEAPVKAFNVRTGEEA